MMKKTWSTSSRKGPLALVLALMLAVVPAAAALGAVAPLPGPGNPLLFDDFGKGGVWGSKGLDWPNWYNQDGGSGKEFKAIVDDRTVGQFTQTPASSLSQAKFQPWNDTVDLSGYRYLNFVMKNPGYVDSRIRIDVSDGTSNYNLTKGWAEVPTTWTESSFDLDALTPAINKNAIRIVVWLKQLSGVYGEILIDEINATTSPYSGTAPTITATRISQSTGFENTNFTFDASYTDVDDQRPMAMELVVDDSKRYPMIEVDGRDFTYTDGKQYTVSTKLAAGTHSYYFRTADGTSDQVTTSPRTVTVDRSMQTIDVNDDSVGSGYNQFRYEGSGWQYGPAGAGSHESDNHYSANAGDYAVFTFIGTGIALHGAKGPENGIVAISVDGGAELEVDTYSSAREENALLYTAPVLANGIHTLKIRVTGQKNASSTGAGVFVDRVRADTYVASLIDSINVSQAGYSANGYKVASVTAVDALVDTSYEILAGTTVIARGNMVDEGITWDKRVYTIDFSSVTHIGNDLMVRSNGVSSYVFPVHANIWGDYTDEMTAFYRLQRLEDTRAAYPVGYSSIAPSDKIFHPAAFQDDAIVDGTHYDLTGGWHDAGDYGKYAGNMWVIGNIAISYARHADSTEVNFDNDDNGIPDLIDEAAYGSDYLMKFATQLNGALYDFRGHSAFKHPQKVTDNIVGTADDRVAAQLAVNGSAKGAASLAATARAITMALAKGKISGSNVVAMQAAAAEYQAGAVVLYDYAINNQSANQGSYTSGMNNALLFAEVELALLTKDAAHITSAAERIATFPALRSTNYWDMGPLAFAEFYPIADSKTKKTIKESLKKQLDVFLSLADDTPYGVLNQFSRFGVNEPHAGFVADAVRYYELFGDSAALRAATEGLYWMVGANPWNFSWVSGVGTDYVTYLHTRLDEQAYSPTLAGLVLPGALVSGPNLKDPMNPASASPWYEDRGLFQDNLSSWRYNEYSLSIQAGLFYSVMALADMNPANQSVSGSPSALTITSPSTGDYVRGAVGVFAQPASSMKSVELNSGAGYAPMTSTGGVYVGEIDTSTMSAYASAKVDVRGTDAAGNQTFSATHYTVAPALPDPSNALLYDDFNRNGTWGGQGLAWVNWWNQDGGSGSFSRTIVDDRSVGRFTQTPASAKSQAKFQPWNDAVDLSGYRYLDFTMKNPGYPDSRIKIAITDGKTNYSLTNGWAAVPTTWTDFSFDLNALAPNLDKRAVKMVIWLSQVGGAYGEMLIDEIAASNTRSGSAPTLTSTRVDPAGGDATTVFTFVATYTDADDEQPFVMEVVVDGVIRRMSPIDASDSTYTDGRSYSYTTTLPQGVHTYYFHTTDTTTDAVSSPAGSLTVAKPSTNTTSPLSLASTAAGPQLSAGWLDSAGPSSYESGLGPTSGGLYAEIVSAWTARAV